jgi:hypothetical protein
MRQVQPETLPKNRNFSSCLQNIKLKNNTTAENFGFLAADAIVTIRPFSLPWYHYLKGKG